MSGCCRVNHRRHLKAHLPRTVLFAALAIAAAADGCRTAPVGRSSFEMLEPIAAPHASTNKDAEASKDIVVIAVPPSSKGELATPVYPPEALAGRAGACEVFVTVTIDTSGVVTEVVPSWQRMNIPGRYSAEFLEAVRSAVRKWQFEPARNVYWRKTANGDVTYMYAETIAAMTDVKFTFDASGGVH